MAGRKKAPKEPWERKRRAAPYDIPTPPPKPAPKPLMATPPLDLDKMGDAEIERVLKAIIFFDGRRVLDENGNGLPLAQLDDATALALGGFEVEELYERGPGGAPRVNTGILKKFKQSDRRAAAETLWKKQGKMGGDGNAAISPNAVDQEILKIVQTLKERKKQEDE